MLAWTEALALLPQNHASDKDYAKPAQHLTPAEMVNLTLATGTINAWSRLALGFRKMLEEGWCSLAYGGFFVSGLP